MDTYLLIHISGSKLTYGLLTEPSIPEHYKSSLPIGDLMFIIKPIDMFFGELFHQPQNGSNNG